MKLYANKLRWHRNYWIISTQSDRNMSDFLVAVSLNISTDKYIKIIKDCGAVYVSGVGYNFEDKESCERAIMLLNLMI